MRVTKAFLDMYRYTFPAKRSSERRRAIDGKQKPKTAQGGEKPKAKNCGAGEPGTSPMHQGSLTSWKELPPVIAVPVVECSAASPPSNP